MPRCASAAQTGQGWNVCCATAPVHPSPLEHLRPLDVGHLIYHNPKPRSDSPRDLVLTPLELIDKIAALIPPSRAHRHRYYGVLAPNSPMRAAVTALAPMPVIVPATGGSQRSRRTTPPCRIALSVGDAAGAYL
jgi:hypothetical protein